MSKRKCYYADKHEMKLFSYCKKCHKAYENNDEGYYIPLITVDIKDNKQCIDFVRKIPQ